MKTLTLKQVQAVRDGHYGQLTKLIHQLAETALAEMVLVNDAKDQARRIYERVQEYTEVRPEHERVLMLLARTPIGLPEIKVYYDTRVKLKVAWAEDNLPLNWEHFAEESPVQNTEHVLIAKRLLEPSNEIDYIP